MSIVDTLGRPVRDLRISVTDRCNFRCVYCMPKEVFGRDYRFLDRRELLTFEEIERLAQAFVTHGVENGQSQRHPSYAFEECTAVETKRAIHTIL